MKIKAFTLSELLIALTVIGVIAIMVLPNLVTGIYERVWSTQLQSIYKAVENTSKKLLADEQAPKLSRTMLTKGSTETVEDTAGAFLKKYFKITKDCEKSSGNCFAAAYKNINGGTVELGVSNDFYCVSVSTGASICLQPASVKSDGTFNYAKFIVDTNGSSQPNMAGYDLFLIYVDEDGEIILPQRSSDAVTKCKSGDELGLYCLVYLRGNNWKIDY